MGQYFNAVFLKQQHKLAKEPVLGAIKPTDFNNLSKIMEHSYIGNYYVNAFMKLVSDEEGIFFDYPCAWIGDSSEPIKGKNYFQISKKYCKQTKYENRDILHSLDKVYFKYAINFSKKEYIVLPKFNHSLVINPLPILLAYGIRLGKNESYYNINPKYVGRWAFNKIGCTNNVEFIIGFKELKINL